MDRLVWRTGWIIWLLLLMVSGSAVAKELRPPEEFGGVGIQVVPTVSGQLVVLNVISEGPAAKAGMLPGDLIYQVNAFPLKGSEFADVVAHHLWGPVDSAVSLYYLRPGLTGTHSVSLRRTNLSPRLTVSPSVLAPDED